ncbi:MAG TPA: bifunctional 2-C-methyl-D-erythritol 4-phosphate cytidylyltransferase/2-C-methyl-D-erythritol 2,4-cyclodiphosphate synthase [Alphaproteobacteria bacterium]|nr:bifunctional 2-C-methyl-D-erythritol 4-phosphate cytidylyltransferase/2-C-methyl-D-erythritol 2,4-cyclodiphosphate synthase [Alphaproteobacteria bacterium]
MTSKSKVAVMIVAAGKGARLGSDLPKQYLKIEGKTILEHSIEAFSKIKNISTIHIVISKEYEKIFNSSIQHPVSYSFGGDTRQESVCLGLEELKKHKPNKVLIHDAARMFTSEELISEIIKKLENHKAVIPAQKIADTVKKIKGENIVDTIDRENLISVQTPQGFDYQTIMKLHRKYKGKNFTDDSSLFEKENMKVKYLLGTEDNFKITTEKDLMKAKEKIEKSKQNRIGIGFDVHQFEEGDGVILCGIKIPYSKKLKGHSDADVAWHALTDAMLGALAKGDIGDLFPDNDMKWKGADSKIFLKKADELMKKMGGRIINIDITIIAERPKLGDYKKIMAENTAKILDISETQVNVKATTTEKLGFVGRGEGISSQAVVSILL